MTYKLESYTTSLDTSNGDVEEDATALCMGRLVTLLQYGSQKAYW